MTSSVPTLKGYEEGYAGGIRSHGAVPAQQEIAPVGPELANYTPAAHLWRPSNGQCHLPDAQQTHPLPVSILAIHWHSEMRRSRSLYTPTITSCHSRLLPSHRILVSAPPLHPKALQETHISLDKWNFTHTPPSLKIIPSLTPGAKLVCLEQAISPPF